MTQEQRIEKAWLAFGVQSFYRYDEKSVKDAIKWADEHPKEGLVSIDKVC